MAAALRTFLNERRVGKDNTAWNITGMSRADCGKYYIPENEYEEFLRLHHDHVFVHGQSSSLLEKHGDYTPIVIDLDFRYTPNTLEREFTKEEIRMFVKSYADAFFKFIDYNDSIRFFVEIKSSPILEKGVKKDGIHILCPDITVDYMIPFTLRKYLLEQNSISCFSGHTNTPSDCFDESVIKRNNWFLHGASKPEKEQYTVTHCFIADPDGGFDETEWDESNRDLTYLFSLQHNRSTPTTISIREDMKDEWNMWESMVDKKPIQNTEIVKYRRNSRPPEYITPHPYHSFSFSSQYPHMCHCILYHMFEVPIFTEYSSLQMFRSSCAIWSFLGPAERR